MKNLLLTCLSIVFVACGAATGASDAPPADANPNAVSLAVGNDNHEFGTVAQGATSAIYSLRITNDGGMPVTVSIALAGDTAPFDIADNCDQQQLANNGDSCDIDVTFTPGAGDAPGVKTFTITITTPDDANIQKFATFTGEVVAGTANLSFNNSVVSMGTEPLGDAAPTKTVILTNDGAGEAMLTWDITGTASGDYSHTTSGCDTSIAGGGMCTITIGFTPSGLIGSKTATLELSDGAGTETVSLVGNGSAMLTISAPTNGNVKSTGANSGLIDCGNGGNNCNQVLSTDAHQNVVLKALAVQGYYINSWSVGSCNDDQNCTITMDGDKTISANFLKYFKLGVTVQDLNTWGLVTFTNVSQGCVDISFDYCKYFKQGGISTTLTASPANSSYEFQFWSGACTGPSTTCNLTMNTDKTVTATFCNSSGGMCIMTAQ